MLGYMQRKAQCFSPMGCAVPHEPQPMRKHHMINRTLTVWSSQSKTVRRILCEVKKLWTSPFHSHVSESQPTSNRCALIASTAISWRSRWLECSTRNSMFHWTTYEFPGLLWSPYTLSLSFRKAESLEFPLGCHPAFVSLILGCSSFLLSSSLVSLLAAFRILLRSGQGLSRNPQTGEAACFLHMCLLFHLAHRAVIIYRWFIRFMRKKITILFFLVTPMPFTFLDGK